MAPPLAGKSVRKSLRLTGPGWVWMIATAGVLTLGLGKSINLLALLGYFLAVVAIFNFVLAGKGLKALRVKRRHRDPVFAGRPCPLEVSVAPGRRACPGVRLEERGSDYFLTWNAAWLGGRAEQTFQGEVILPRRGRYERGPLWGFSGYPFGLAERGVVLAPAEEIYVLPRLGSMRRGGFRTQQRVSDPKEDRQRRRPTHPAAQGEVHGLRPFRTGDSPRTIHWKTSARRGELMVREFEDEPGDALLLVVDPVPRAMPDADAHFEEAISLAATLVREWCRGGAVRLVLAVAGPTEPLLLDGIAGPALVQRALEFLAEAVANGNADTLLGRLAALANPPAGIVVVSAGSDALAGLIGRHLRRPVNALDVTDPSVFDFYEPPGPGQEESGAVSERIVLHPLGK
jgi:uncharacterized protein (DUF58 family)